MILQFWKNYGVLFLGHGRHSESAWQKFRASARKWQEI